MKQFEKSSLMIAYDNTVGVVYHPAKGALTTTTPQHAKIIEHVFEDYVKGGLSSAQQNDFEAYIEKSFQNKQEKPLAVFPGLDKTDAIDKLEIMLANDCNLNCKYCYAHGGTYDCQAQRMKPETAIDYLNKLLVGKYHTVKIVMFFGGEPTLCPDTMAAICAFFEQHVGAGVFADMPVFTMVTNGTLINEDLVRTIHKYNIRVTVSLDGPPEINDQLRVDRAGHGTFAVVERGIEALTAAGCPPRLIEATYTSLHHKLGYTKADIQSYLQNRLGIEHILVANCGAGGLDETLVFADGYPACPQEEAELTQQEQSRLFTDLSKTSFYDLSCDAGLASFALLPNGELYPCHFFVGKPEYRIARYAGGSFDFSGYAAVVSRLAPARKLQNPKCKDCWAKPLCSSCPASMLLWEEVADSFDFCQNERTRLKQFILKLVKKELSQKQVSVN